MLELFNHIRYSKWSLLLSQWTQGQVVVAILGHLRRIRCAFPLSQSVTLGVRGGVVTATDIFGGNIIL